MKNKNNSEIVNSHKRNRHEMESNMWLGRLMNAMKDVDRIYCDENVFSLELYYNGHTYIYKFPPELEFEGFESHVDDLDELKFYIDNIKAQREAERIQKEYRRSGLSKLTAEEKKALGFK